MPEFNLTPEQIGELSAEGGIVTHPNLDIFGQLYDRRNATRKQFTIGGKRVFVVIPAGKDSEDNTFKLAGDKAAAKKE